MADTKEGKIAVPGGNVWYKIEGADSPGIPLLLLHGGPGAGHDYFEPLTALADERPVVFYDQLGCGKSDMPEDPSLWQVPRFVEEVAAVRKALDLDSVHVLGQSWGGWLALEYMLTDPRGVISLTLANTSASVADFIGEARRMVSELPQDVRETIERCEASGETNSAKYISATMVFYQKHACRLDPWPDYVMRTIGNISATPVYGQMWGPSEFHVTGTLEGWDVSDRLPEITTRTLILSGRYDEMGPACLDTLRSGIPQPAVHVFEESSHMPFAEEPEEFERVLRGFLNKSETGIF